MKTLGTITTHINIEKLNERGKKKLNAKLKCHLAKFHTLPYEVSTFIYMDYIDVYYKVIFNILVNRLRLKWHSFQIKV